MSNYNKRNRFKFEGGGGAEGKGEAAGTKTWPIGRMTRGLA